MKEAGKTRFEYGDKMVRWTTILILLIEVLLASGVQLVCKRQSVILMMTIYYMLLQIGNRSLSSMNDAFSFLLSWRSCSHLSEVKFFKLTNNTYSLQQVNLYNWGPLNPRHSPAQRRWTNHHRPRVASARRGSRWAYTHRAIYGHALDAG